MFVSFAASGCMPVTFSLAGSLRSTSPSNNSFGKWDTPHAMPLDGDKATPGVPVNGLRRAGFYINMASVDLE